MDEAGANEASETTTIEAVHDLQRSMPVSTTVLQAVAEQEDVDPIDLPTLHDIIDPDALDALFCGRPTGQTEMISFSFAGYRITVVGHDRIILKSESSVDPNRQQA